MLKQISSSLKKDIVFLGGTSSSKWIPKSELPEFAFFGRSNVGKSSLINYLCNRKDISRVSNTPGRTTEINFFKIDNLFTLVDLPGYGYAKRSMIDREKWLRIIEHYFLHRMNLMLVFILIDSRRGIMPIDLDVIDYLNKIKKDFQIIFTKYDKIVNKTKIIEDCKKDLLQYNHTKQFIFTSSRGKYGAEEVQLSLASYFKGG